MKRKAEQSDEPESPTNAKRQATGQRGRFREGLFDQNVLDSYSKSYHDSAP